jgi:hypothetical protein
MRSCSVTAPMTPIAIAALADSNTRNQASAAVSGD